MIRVNIDDAALAERRVTTLMGDKVKPRRDWIEENVRFNGTEEGDNILEKVDVTDPIDSKIVDDLLNKE